MQLMSMPVVAGISLGVAIITIFSRKHRGKAAGERALVSLGSFLATLLVLFILNFAIFCVQQS
ncbi:hypothetical protein C6558_25050 [Ensifer sp. NM-2]|uniref:hypothetical protein n=1 Tax=Ensifer TaxID=106591 RepID=UPI00046CE734|nr:MULTISPECIES: hypothetical protein [Ensifer]KQU94559.1 hypothetical protein ASD00_21830 [Ensifer sp. Root31]NOV17597.1 hypothetical protein [Ensifer canadensis]PSS62051.1 hypothetical protein C6558_25050 [Ensifer sp. NM-2]